MTKYTLQNEFLWGCNVSVQKIDHNIPEQKLHILALNTELTELISVLIEVFIIGLIFMKPHIHM